MKRIKDSLKKNKIVMAGYRQFGQFLSIINPEKASRMKYRSALGRELNLEYPSAMTEKMMYLKLRKFWNNQFVANCADKYTVRSIIRDYQCPEILTKLYGVWDNAEDIDWNQLPQKFVLKCNHGSGYNLVCKNKDELDIEETKKQLNKWLKERYGISSVEQGIYDRISRKIIAEEFIETADGLPPKDYKFFCSFGEVKLIFVASDRIPGKTKFDFYYPSWTHINVRNVFPNNGPIEKPKDLEKMIRYAELLSKDLPMVRVDLYNEAGKIFFGELTFTHFGCLNGFTPDSFDFEFGKLFPPAEELGRWERSISEGFKIERDRCDNQ